MKKLFVVAILAVISLCINAQKTVGTLNIQPKVGVTIANLTDIEANSTRIGMIAGAEVSYTVHPMVDVEAGLLYSMQGCDFEAEIGDCNFKLEYINLPIMASANIYKGLRVRTGIQVGFLTKANEKLANVGEFGVKEMINKVDISLPLGLSYEYSNFILDTRYNLGLNRTFKSGNEFKSKNSVFNITLGYKFSI